MRIMITGGAGFIGSALVRSLVRQGRHEVLNVDKLTYAGGLDSLSALESAPGYQFSRTDIADGEALWALVRDFRPQQIFHLAAESHVDRSISGARPFIQSNVVGTFELLEVMRRYINTCVSGDAEQPRMLCVSTDEVYGDLAADAPPFSEATPYAPSSPYSATKAAADHLARAWHRTYGLPVIISNCSNNFGPYQYPEKLIPTMIIRALAGQPLPVYGDGLQVRDWLYVDDHVDALLSVMAQGRPGETYMIGGFAERANIDVINMICALLARHDGSGRSAADFAGLIEHVADRPGHDRRYAVDSSKLQREIGWRPVIDLEEGLARTVQWYCDNRMWWQKRL